LFFCASVHARSIENIDISFEKVKIYTSEDINSPYFFASIHRVSRNSKYLYVTDWKRNLVKIFDHEFNYIKEFGKKGEGPGEFKQIFVDLVCDDENIYVLTLAHLNIFTIEGEFVKRVNLNIIPKNMYLVNNGYLFKNLNSEYSFFLYEDNFNFLKKFCKSQILSTKHCRRFYVTPCAFLTKSKEFLIFDNFQYKIDLVNIDTQKTYKSIKRDVDFQKTFCKKQKFKSRSFYGPTGGFSFMVEDEKYYYYFYKQSDNSKKIDIYNKSFKLLRSGEYQENINISVAGFKGQNFIGYLLDDANKVVVFKMVNQGILQ
jgi:hypothetical protein